MTEMKRKSRDGAGRSNSKKPKTSAARKGGGGGDEKRRGPRLPSRLLKVINGLNTSKTGSPSDSDGDERFDSDDGEVYAKSDVYEYEEGMAEEEARKNHRFDAVENLEYEMPEEFEDENVSSDDDIHNGDAGDNDSEGEDDEDEDEDDRHVRMLEGVTGMPGEAFEGNKKNNSNAVVTDYNPGPVSMNPLLASLKGKSFHSKVKKMTDHMDRNAAPTQAPLHKAEKERLERKAAYEHSKKDLYKWEPLIKRNREAPTMIFDNDADLGFSTVGAIASEFEPRTEFEKKIASLVHADKVMDAHKEDGSRLLELNQVSVEDERDRQNRIAKMRSLLFRHEIKAKHIKKIKSKAFHRLLKKDKLKAASSENQMDPEAAKDLARKQEYERAKERMTLRHKGNSKWSKRIKERGLDAQDEGTRAAVAEQQNIHAALVRKMRSMGDSSSDSEESGDENESEDNSSGSEQHRVSKLISEAKEKTLKVLNDEDGVPNSGLLSLPFMMRGMKKRNEAAAEEAKLAFEDFESLSKQLDGSNEAESPKSGTSKGRMVFNAAGKQAAKSSKIKLVKKTKVDKFYDDSDSENEEAEDNDFNGNDGSNDVQKDPDFDFNLLREVSEVNQDGLLENFVDIIKDPGSKTTHEVALFASGSWKKAEGGNNGVASKKKPSIAKNQDSGSNNQVIKETAKDLTDDSDSETEGRMIDGILSSGPKASYELPSQDELIHQAFAADDVEDEFERHKQEVLNEENPEPEKPVLLPGWGQWTNVQQKRGLPSWMVKEHETAKKKREEAIKKRKDAKLKHVIISEKLDKRAEKLYTKALPFPYTSKEVFEQSIRMPIGPEFNPATTVSALNRPDVVKKPGQIIKPIEFEEVNPHDKAEPQKHGGHVQKPKKKKNPKQKQKQKLKQKN